MKIHSMRGQVVDMTRLAAENAHKIALGNASMNARGDLIGNGSIVKLREQIARDYHVANPKAVRQVALRDIKTEVFVSPAEAIAAHSETRSKPKRKITDAD